MHYYQPSSSGINHRMSRMTFFILFSPSIIQVMKNLHVVFTMNPSEDGLKDKAATSPALFNRCVLNWFGDWGLSALFQVGREFTLKMDLERPAWKQPDFLHFKVRRRVSQSSWESGGENKYAWGTSIQYVRKVFRIFDPKCSTKTINPS